MPLIRVKPGDVHKRESPIGKLPNCRRRFWRREIKWLGFRPAHPAIMAPRREYFANLRANDHEQPAVGRLNNPRLHCPTLRRVNLLTAEEPAVSAIVTIPHLNDEVIVT